MQKEIDKAQVLLGVFEKLSAELGGLDDLSEALEIISDVINDGSDEYSVKKARNLLIRYKGFISKAASGLLEEPKRFSTDNIDYWHDVLQEIINFGFADNDTTFQSFIKLKEDARRQSLPFIQRITELRNNIDLLPKEEQDRRRQELRELLRYKGLTISGIKED